MYTSRKGKQYFLHSVVTKNGNLKYTFTLKNDDNCIEEIPIGYEIYEPPNGNIFLRKKINNHFIINEIDIIESALKKHCKYAKYVIDYKKDGVGIYIDHKYQRQKSSLDLTYSMLGYTENENIYFEPSFKFSKDNEQPNYTIERYCFLGGVNNWVYIENSNDLIYLCNKFGSSLFHVGKRPIFPATM